MRRFFSFIAAIAIFSLTALAQEAIKVDEFTNLPCDDYLGRMDAAMQKAHENPTAHVIIYLYVGRERIYNKRTKKTELVFPTVNSAKVKLASMKTYVEEIRKFPAGKIKFEDGGLREQLSVEIWVVPAGAKDPSPSPTIKTIKYRRGGAVRFCLNCCDF